ncbi:hypothetical protein TBK1r_32610 [Stieleria magnilauensis]|uniref:Transposase n=1 Tax=Stieleria magnilauensis TaxID=2527963 RepID=A0ABX5XUI4_9BACT|nr:hypothetical protein TBK1r_32610 [Planctomycetes bacterium TBK1r]
MNAALGYKQITRVGKSNYFSGPKKQAAVLRKSFGRYPIEPVVPNVGIVPVSKPASRSSCRVTLHQRQERVRRSA